MNRLAMVMLAFVTLCGAAAAQGYEREDKERPLKATVVVDEEGGNTYVFLHSDPTPWTGVEGIKNPLFGVTVRGLSIGKWPMVVAPSSFDAGVTYQVPFSFDPSWSEARMRAELAREKDGPMRRELSNMKLDAARFDSDRTLTLDLMLLRVRGYDDELKYSPEGKLLNTYEVREQMEVLLPDHLFRMTWHQPGFLLPSTSAWMDNPDLLNDLRLVLDRNPHEGHKLYEIKSRPAPSHIVVCCKGVIWQGEWSAIAGSKTEPSNSVRVFGGNGYTEQLGMPSGQ